MLKGSGKAEQPIATAITNYDRLTRISLPLLQRSSS